MSSFPGALIRPTVAVQRVAWSRWLLKLSSWDSPRFNDCPKFHNDWFLLSEMIRPAVQSFKMVGSCYIWNDPPGCPNSSLHKRKYQVVSWFFLYCSLFSPGLRIFFIVSSIFFVISTLHDTSPFPFSFQFTGMKSSPSQQQWLKYISYDFFPLVCFTMVYV